MASNTKYSLQRVGASEQIFDILKKKIAVGQWKVGDRIPSENELADQFGVSRMTARNALQRLNAIGLVETKVGDGTFVKEFRLATYFSEITDLIDTDTSMKEIREFRKFFEAACLEIACKRCTQDAMDQIRRQYERMQQVADSGDEEAFFYEDMQFHRCLCEMTGNDVFLIVQNITRELMLSQLKKNSKQYFELKGGTDNPKDENYRLKLLAKDHFKYIRALEARDASIAIDDLNSYLEQYESGGE